MIKNPIENNIPKYSIQYLINQNLYNSILKNNASK